MTDEGTGSSLAKLSSRKNVIPISSISDLGSVVSDVQAQINTLISKLENDVSPEFKALMESYIKKANETEELKVNIENIKQKSEEVKSEIGELRDTNRNLVNELQNTRETLGSIEEELDNLKLNTSRTEDEYKDKIKGLKKLNLEYEDKINILQEEKEKLKSVLEEKMAEFADVHESIRQELLDQSYEARKIEQELIIQKDNLKKQVEEFEVLIREQQEQIDLKVKEIEYKDALLNQFIKQSMNERLANQQIEQEEKYERKKIFGIF